MRSPAKIFHYRPQIYFNKKLFCCVMENSTVNVVYDQINLVFLEDANFRGTVKFSWNPVIVYYCA